MTDYANKNSMHKQHTKAHKIAHKSTQIHTTSTQKCAKK